MDRVRDWIGVATDRRIVARSLGTCLVVGFILTLVNHGDELSRGSIGSIPAWQVALTFIVPFLVATAASAAAIRSRGADGSERDSLRRRLTATATFAESDPDPALALSRNGRIEYANRASQAILTAWGVGVGGEMPRTIPAELMSFAASTPTQGLEVRADSRVFEVLLVDEPYSDVLLLYGTDITDRKAAETLPDLDPSPVLQISAEGILVYANPSSAPMRRALDVELNGRCPADLLARLYRSSKSGDRLAITAAGRTYWLTPVAIPEAGLLNVYTTEVRDRR